jgi:hypothetical protein
MQVDAENLCRMYLDEIERIHGKEFAKLSSITSRSGWYYIWLARREGPRIIECGDRWNPIRKREFVEALILAMGE